MKWQVYSAQRKIFSLVRLHKRNADLKGRIIARHYGREGRAIASDLVELWRRAETRLRDGSGGTRLHATIDPGPLDDGSSFVGMPFKPDTREASAAIERFAWLDVLLARGFQLFLAPEGHPNSAEHSSSQLRARVKAAFATLTNAVSDESKPLLRRLAIIRTAVPRHELWSALPELDAKSRRDAFGPWRQSIESALITLDPDRKLVGVLNQTCVRNTRLDIAAGIYVVHIARRAARRTVRRSVCLNAVLYAAWFSLVFAALWTPGIPSPAGLIPSVLWLAVLFPIRSIVANIRYRIACMCSGARRVLAPPVAEGDFVLFLRAFSTDDELVDDRTPFEFLRVTSWLLPTMTPFRMRLIESLGGFRRVIAIADPAHREGDGDYGLIELPEPRWQHNVKRAAAQASLIVVDLNDCRSPGFQWELDAVVRQEYVEKLVFVMPFGPRRFFPTIARRLRRVGHQVVQTEEAFDFVEPPPSHRGFYLLPPPDRYELRAGRFANASRTRGCHASRPTRCFCSSNRSAADGCWTTRRQTCRGIRRRYPLTSRISAGNSLETSTRR